MLCGHVVWQDRIATYGLVNKNQTRNFSNFEPCFVMCCKGLFVFLESSGYYLDHG
jgi:hypothetical protein